jgi:hypothetical protein
VRVEAGLGGLKEERDLWCGAGDPKPGGLGFAGLCVRGTAERRDGGDLMEERDAEPRRRAAVSEKAGNGRGDSRRQRPAATVACLRACERGERDETN